MIKNNEDIRKICEEVNDMTKCNVKTGIQINDHHISIYDSNNYDDMFGYQVLSQLDIDEDQLENKYYNSQLKAKLIQKICNITGIAIITAAQKK